MTHPAVVINDGVEEHRPSMAERAQTDLGHTSGTFGLEGDSEPTGHDGHHQSRGLRLMIRKYLNMLKFSGEQVKTNKVHYSTWSKNIKDHLEPTGPDGIELVKAMMRAVSSGRNTKVTDAMVEQRFSRSHQHGHVNQLQLLMKNWTGGQADKTISYDVHNGIDSRRKLHHQHLPDTAHQQETFMQELNNPKLATDIEQLRERMQERERITPL